MTTDFDRLLQFFKALANESRLKLIGLLTQQERSVEELATLLNLKEPTVSHHLSKLKALNLVSLRPEGNTHYYQLNLDTLQTLQKAMLNPSHIQTLDPELSADIWETKVLKAFIENSQIKEIPASRKKRWIILKWLVQKFEFDRHYPERELNALLKPIHPDTATLRREMVGYNMMGRENSVYWRVPEMDWQVPADYEY